MITLSHLYQLGLMTSCWAWSDGHWAPLLNIQLCCCWGGIFSVYCSLPHCAQWKLSTNTVAGDECPSGAHKNHISVALPWRHDWPGAGWQITFTSVLPAGQGCRTWSGPSDRPAGRRSCRLGRELTDVRASQQTGWTERRVGGLQRRGEEPEKFSFKRPCDIWILVSLKKKKVV